MVPVVNNTPQPLAPTSKRRFQPSKPKKTQGLDEAQVAYSQLKISDWFYKYNEKEEPEEDWRSASNIRWIFTYRCEEDGNESFYKFPKMKELAQIEVLQPLTGLQPDAVDEAFKDFSVSTEFKEAVIEKAGIS
jgi:hypothetical protein